MYPTLLTPNAILLGIYWVVVYALQIGFCLILVTARKEETKVCLPLIPEPNFGLRN
jgi:hypothetical protein